MTARQILLDQFAACHDTNGWFVARDEALSGLTSRQAAWRGDPSDHSIAEAHEKKLDGPVGSDSPETRSP